MQKLDLAQIRCEIDKIDKELVACLNQRWQLIAKVTEVKQLKPQQSPDRPYREAQVLSYLQDQEFINNADLTAIFKEIMAISAQKQNKFDILATHEIIQNYRAELFYEFGRHGKILQSSSDYICQELGNETAGMAVISFNHAPEKLLAQKNCQILSLFPSCPILPKPVGLIIGWQEKESDDGAKSAKIYRDSQKFYCEQFDKIPNDAIFHCFVPKMDINFLP